MFILVLWKKEVPLDKVLTLGKVRKSKKFLLFLFFSLA